MFWEYLGFKKDGGQSQKIFARVRDIRRALGQAMAAQEMTYFSGSWNKESKGTPWPQKDNTKIIKIKPKKQELDNEMSLCIDGQEVIRCYSNMEDIKSHDNKVVSELGKANIEVYRNKQKSLLDEKTIEGVYDDALETLEDLIEKGAQYTTPEYEEIKKVSRQIDELRP